MSRYPLKLRGIGKAEIARARRQRARSGAAWRDWASVRSTSSPAARRQRVALARAIVFEPRILLMDEPLSALDKKLREQMQIEIRHLHQRLGMTTVYVTHDQREALTMSDRIAVIDRGRFRQIGTPREIYGRPESRFIAEFIGESHFLPVSVRGDQAYLGAQLLRLAEPLRSQDAIPAPRRASGKAGRSERRRHGHAQRLRRHGEGDRLPGRKLAGPASRSLAATNSPSGSRDQRRDTARGRRPGSPRAWRRPTPSSCRRTPPMSGRLPCSKPAAGRNDTGCRHDGQRPASAGPGARRERGPRQPGPARAAADRDPGAGADRAGCSGSRSAIPHGFTSDHYLRLLHPSLHD